MYAIRSYYVLRGHPARRQSPCQGHQVLCAVKVCFCYQTFLNSSSESCDEAISFRITSYNVCYTKLLRDEIGKMDFTHRRDAFCGKFSLTDVFEQYKVPYTVLTPHVVHPATKEFQENLKDFGAICRVVNGMKNINIGCIGARTTAFKTVRYDEITVQRHKINIESFDLSELIFKVQNKSNNDIKVIEKIERLKSFTDCSKVPEKNMYNLAKTGVVLDEYIEEYQLV